MTEQEIQAAIVEGGELEKIKTDYQGKNPRMTVVLTDNTVIEYDLSRGWWRNRVPALENGTLVLPSPQDQNPIRAVEDNKLTEIYKQEEFLIPVENIAHIKFNYDRVVISDISESGD